MGGASLTTGARIKCIKLKIQMDKNVKTRERCVRINSKKKRSEEEEEEEVRAKKTTEEEEEEEEFFDKQLNN